MNLKPDPLVLSLSDNACHLVLNPSGISYFMPDYLYKMLIHWCLFPAPLTGTSGQLMNPVFISGLPSSWWWWIRDLKPHLGGRHNSSQTSQGIGHTWRPCWNRLLGAPSASQWVLEGAWEFAFLTCSPMMLILPVQRLHFGNHCISEKTTALEREDLGLRNPSGFYNFCNLGGKS